MRRNRDDWTVGWLTAIHIRNKLMSNNETRKQTTTTGPLRMTLLAVAVIVTASAAWGQDGFEIIRSTIDGGGAVASTGGDFELNGTIGQPDAGVLIGDEFTLTGGFWFAIDEGDCNTDGSLNIFDFSEFAACVSGPGSPPADQECACADFDGDGDVDLTDFGLTQVNFQGQ